jgi:hypothetical protein
MRRKSTRTVLACLLVGFGLQAFSQSVRVAELVVGGVSEAEAKVLRARLPFAPGSSFASIGEARRLAGAAKAYLEQDEGYAGVDVDIEEAEDGTIEVYVFPRPASIAAIDVFESELTTIPHFPVYGLGTGFAVGAEEQLLGLDLALGRLAALDLLAGHSQSTASDQALVGKAGLSVKPLPLFSAYGLAGIDSYLPGSIGGTDGYWQAGAKLDLGFLSRLAFLGPSIQVSYRRAFLDYSYSAFRGKATIGFDPIGFLKAEAMANLYRVSDRPAPLAAAGEEGARELRLVPEGLPDSGIVASASFSARLSLPLRIKLGFSSLGLGLFGFVEASEAVGRLGEIRSPWDLPPTASSPAVGGGLVLSLAPPISIAFELGCGYSLARRQFAFILRTL